MRFLVGLILISLPFSSFASFHSSVQIHDIDFGDKLDDHALVLLKDGHVTKVPKWDAILLEELKEAKENALYLNVDTDEDRFISGFEKTLPPVPDPMAEMNEEKEAYVPTVIPSMDEAKKLFRAARYNPKESQCFNRAMVWTYEWYKKFGVKSNKLLIYFTRNYIRRFNFDWWFHITPFVLVNDNGQVVERTMDVKYSRGPLKFRNWSKIFLRDDAVCPVITRYSDYADYPYVGSCMLQRTTMYTYQPADLQMLEAFNYRKTDWIPAEVNGAYLEAFDEVVDISAGSETDPGRRAPGTGTNRDTTNTGEGGNSGSSTGSESPTRPAPRVTPRPTPRPTLRPDPIPAPVPTHSPVPTPVPTSSTTNDDEHN